MTFRRQREPRRSRARTRRARDSSLARSEAEAVAAATRPWMRCRSAWCWPTAAGRTSGAERRSAATTTGMPPFWSKRRSSVISGGRSTAIASGQSVEFIGPPRTVLAVQAIPLEDGGALVDDRRRQRAGPARRRPHRLRRQHQPRVEDPRRRVGRAGRGAGRQRRPGGRPSPGRQDGRRGPSGFAAPSTICWSCRAPNWVARRPHDVVVGRRRPRRSGASCQVGRRAALGACRRSVDRRRRRRPSIVRRSGRPVRQLVSAVANLLENAVKYSDAGAEVVVGAGVTDGWVEIVRRRHRCRHPGPRHRPDLRTVLPRRSGPSAATQAVPASAWRSCATWPPTTLAR